MGEIVNSNMFTGFMKGMTKELGTQITASEKRKVEAQRAAATALKAENLARFKTAMAEETAQKNRDIKVSEGEKDRSSKAEQSGLDRISREKIAGMKDTAAADKPITEQQAMSLAQKTGLTESKEIKDFADRIMGKKPEEVEMLIKKKGFWGEVGDVFASIFGGGEAEAKAPTVSGKPVATAPTEAPTVSPAPAPAKVKVGAKKLDRTIAVSILKEAGGDKVKARKIAEQRGYTF